MIIGLTKLAGFGSIGIAAGSLAAWIQSTFFGGLILKGSLFALLQSIGATGMIGTFGPSLLAFTLLSLISIYYVCFYVNKRS